MTPYDLYMAKVASASRRAIAALTALSHGEAPLFHMTQAGNMPAILEYGLRTPLDAIARGHGPVTVEGYGRTRNQPSLSPYVAQKMQSVGSVARRLFRPGGNLGGRMAHSGKYLQREFSGNRDWRLPQYRTEPLEGANPGQWVITSAYPSSAPKNSLDIAFSRGVPYGMKSGKPYHAPYGDVGVVSFPHRVRGGELVSPRTGLHEPDTRIGEQVYASASSRPIGGKISLPVADPAMVTYIPSPDKAEWVRDLKNRGIHTLPLTRRVQRQLPALGGHLGGQQPIALPGVSR